LYYNEINGQLQAVTTLDLGKDHLPHPWDGTLTGPLNLPESDGGQKISARFGI